MTIEESIRIIRHLNQHIQEMKEGKFKKEQKYLYELGEARMTALEMAHDLVYIMREKCYKGYEDADFQYNVRLPEDIHTYEVDKYTVESFETAVTIRNKLEFFEAKTIQLDVKDAEKQMNILGKATRDLSVGIELFQEYFKVRINFGDLRV